MAQIIESGVFRALDSNNDPVNLAEFFLFDEGTTDPVTVYSDAALSVVAGNSDDAPVQSDSSGVFPTVYVGAGRYKIDIRTAAGSSLPGYPVDGVSIGSLIKDNFSATRAPLVTDDASEGYEKGSRWIYNGQHWICSDATTDNAVWNLTTISDPPTFAGINVTGPIFQTEQAAADADVAGDGQWWVKDETPNTPMFTDDAGTDYQLATVDGAETLENKTLLGLRNNFGLAQPLPTNFNDTAFWSVETGSGITVRDRSYDAQTQQFDSPYVLEFAGDGSDSNQVAQMNASADGAVTVVPGASYLVTAHFLATGSPTDGARVQIDWRQNDGTYISSSAFTVDAADYASIAEKSGEAVAPSTARKATISLQRNGTDTTGTWYAGAPKLTQDVADIISSEYESGESAITAGGRVTLTHGLGVVPKIIDIHAICKTAEHGYAVGDRYGPLPAATHGDGNNRGLAVWYDATNIRIEFGTYAPITGISTSGARVAFTNASWNVVVRAFS